LVAISHSSNLRHRRHHKVEKSVGGGKREPDDAERLIKKRHRKYKKKRNKWLTHLDLSDCKGITNAGVKALRNVPNLKVLKLGGCERVREKALVKVIHTLNKLRDVDLRDLELSENAIVFVRVTPPFSLIDLRI